MIHPAVNEQLQPFIVASWHGHRDDAEIPAAVREVWQQKFRLHRGPQSQMQSNVDLAVLDSTGRVVHWFDGFPQQRWDRRESLAQYTARELREAIGRLPAKELSPRNNPLILPDLKTDRGIRVLVSLQDDRMQAYQAPVVEVVPLTAEDWSLLAWPAPQRDIDASGLAKWLAQVYPPGVMERTDPLTKRAYQIKSVEGRLSLAEAGGDQTMRYATLSGNIRLTDEGRDGFRYDGNLEVVLTYKPDSPAVHSLRGVYEGIYPRFDRMQNRTRYLPLQAVFESRPDESHRRPPR